jgi:hypothetical protein
MCSFLALSDCIVFPLPPSVALCRRHHPFPRRHRIPTLALMAGKSQVLPVDAWICSSVTERRLEELVRDGDRERPGTCRSGE